MKSLAILVITATIAGCAYTMSDQGRDFDDAKINSLKKGVTTKAQVTELFGEPQERSISSDGERWTYSHLKTGNVGTTMYSSWETRGKVLKVQFNGEVIKDYEFKTVSRPAGNPLLGQQ